MRFRIGINLGDVMVDGADIYGDGVNIAARLQELAEPGGIVISGSVYDQVRNKLSVGFDCLGQQPMKNVAPVTSYRVAMGGRAAGRAACRLTKAHPPGRKPLQRRTPALDGSATDTSPPRGCASSRRFANLPRPIAAALTIAGFLVLINLFTSPHRIWFHWPVMALLFISIMRTVLRRGRGRDRNDDR